MKNNTYDYVYTTMMIKYFRIKNNYSHILNYIRATLLYLKICRLI